MRGIKTVDGREHELDTILYATGFDLEASLKAFTQTGIGEEDNLVEWRRSPYAYKGITHPNHPNFFILLGQILGTPAGWECWDCCRSRDGSGSQQYHLHD